MVREFRINRSSCEVINHFLPERFFNIELMKYLPKASSQFWTVQSSRSHGILVFVLLHYESLNEVAAVHFRVAVIDAVSFAAQFQPGPVKLV
eukprot:scaffold99212_cov35-Prasinocladus_malaysianus.AAC.2